MALDESKDVSEAEGWREAMENGGWHHTVCAARSVAGAKDGAAKASAEATRHDAATAAVAVKADGVCVIWLARWRFSCRGSVPVSISQSSTVVFASVVLFPGSLLGVTGLDSV
jgi:hypothetical protein